MWIGIELKEEPRFIRVSNCVIKLIESGFNLHTYMGCYSDLD